MVPAYMPWMRLATMGMFSRNLSKAAFWYPLSALEPLRAVPMARAVRVYEPVRVVGMSEYMNCTWRVRLSVRLDVSRILRPRIGSRLSSKLNSFISL